MNSEVRLLFHELVDLSPGDRERVWRERQIAPEVRAEIESLLSFDSTKVECLTDCVSDAAEEVLRSANRGEPISCGPYRLIRLLGSGGMGAVYLAERSDGEIQHKVAVKLLHADAHRPAWRGRFLKERQLLASLNHPSIVHVIDAGHTDDGRPYLVMEYVEGTPIDVYAAGIEVRERLSLFLRVCDGVSHAHGHLIIHRDLKPANILVDASGQPKLLDFGIAKLLDETGDATQTVERLLTPNYASPEQVRGGSQTTATDVYSLGAVLYKLLTGRSPHESDTADASRLKASIPTDIDYVVAKALRQEPEERYASVEAFANDIRAFLDSKPVQARSGNAWYRTRKFLRRYWLPVVAAALVIVSLSGGLYVANRERAIAQRRFLQVRRLANQFFALDKTIQTLPGATEARHQIVSTSMAYLEALGAEARDDRELALEIGTAYLQVARVQGVPSGSNLGDFEEADKTLAKAERVVDSVLRAEPKNRRALRTSAEIAHDRMILATGTGAEPVLTQVHKLTGRLEALLATGNASSDDVTMAARLLLNVAQAHNNLRLFDDAIHYERLAVETSRPVPTARLYQVRGLTLLASSLRQKGDLEGALQAIGQARPLAESATYPSEMQRSYALQEVLLAEGVILGSEDGVDLGRPEAAIPPLRESFDLMEQLAIKDSKDSTSRYREVNSGTNLAFNLAQREPASALAIYDQYLLRLREVRDSLNRQINEALCLAASSHVLLRLHRLPEAKQRIDAAFVRLREAGLYPAEHVDIKGAAQSSLRAMAEYQEALGQRERAAASYQELLDRVMASKPEPRNDLAHANILTRLYAALSNLYRRTGRPGKAEVLETSRLELWQDWDRKLPNNSLIRRQLAAASLR
jgi:tetratricopeptide (TPR) repeat protein